MLTLYVKPNCPFSGRVRATLDQLELEADIKDVSSDPAIAEELIAIGGKKQEPFLHDSDNDVKMYDSDQIVDYLKTTYGVETSAVTGPRVHQGGSVCISCEG